MLRRMASNGPNISRQLRSVLDRINAAAQRRPEHLQKREPRLVAVSKTKPVSMIIEAYACGQRHFGENYVQELADKSIDPEIREKCKDIQWHFIGHLQRNKVNKVTGSPGLYMVETVDSEKIAQALNNSWGKQSASEPLAVMLQVNTSGEENKSGADPKEADKMAFFIRDKCPHLRLAGLMTIGSVQSSTSEGPNPDFQCLSECRKMVASALGVEEQDLELSMGMSQDYERAVEAGSTNVRVGSTIFGARDYPPQQSNGTPSQNSSDNPSASSQASEKSGDTAQKCVAKDTPEATANYLDHLSLGT
ncbi:pyridoxal phosphate homeostasis protein-like [Littorina saxatilis]|uniref:Pyridoxal phosphate homeostasis protein n=1 Tax=Littorina saxatilis TaxID=31220 RepID=A0AAN9GIK2_9CAEN